MLPIKVTLISFHGPPYLYFPTEYKGLQHLHLGKLKQVSREGIYEDVYWGRMNTFTIKQERKKERKKLSQIDELTKVVLDLSGTIILLLRSLAIFPHLSNYFRLRIFSV